jgi:MGT family glycosyltransferase
MSRYLFTCWPFDGHIVGPMVIARAVRERGHDVAIYTGETGRATVEREGFELFTFRQVDEERAYENMRTLESRVQGVGPRGGQQLLRTFREWLVETIPNQVADLEPVIDEWRPDVIMTDLSMWAPVVILWEKARLPVVAYQTLMGPLIPGPDAPPWGLGMAPPKTRRERALARTITAVTELAGTGLRRRLDTFRRDHGLPPMGCTFNEFTGRLPLYLVGSLAELDYNRRDLPQTVHYLGACIWRPPPDPETSAWLDAIPSERPWVHATEATLHYGDPIILRAAAHGLAEADVEVIMTTGRQRDPQRLDLGTLAPNMHLTRWLSHGELMPRCSVMVTAGGTSTILSSLQAGVPLVVVPTNWDKPDNARRVVEAGVGVSLAPQKCTPEGLRGAVEEVLVEPAYREAARRVAELLARAPGPPRAAELLEKLADSSTWSAPAGPPASRVTAGRPAVPEAERG